MIELLANLWRFLLIILLIGILAKFF